MDSRGVVKYWADEPGWYEGHSFGLTHGEQVMLSATNNGKTHTIVLILISYIVLLVVAVPLFRFFYDLTVDTTELDYSVPIKIINKTNQDIIAIVFPIVTSPTIEGINKLYPTELAVKSRAEQVRIKKNSEEFTSYYLGYKVDVLTDIIIGIAVWKTSDDPNDSLFQKEPYLIKTFYDPEFKVGPDEYEHFTEFTVE